MTGNGVHLVTVNDYLAKRDSTWKAPLFEFHGMSVDCIDNHSPNSTERRKAYEADITYGTNNEFGFDYLRDNMAHSPEDLVQRKHNYAIVDEVDSVSVSYTHLDVYKRQKEKSPLRAFFLFKFADRIKIYNTKPNYEFHK